MIPKIIHYCWFGRNPLPEMAQKCIASWKKFLPDYEIKEWNEDNFDVNMIPYTREAYRLKKYAFVSDYARFWVLYNYGGLYFDTDVEVIKPLNDIIEKGAFAGFENNTRFSGYAGMKAKQPIAPGLGLGAPAYLPLFGELIDFYNNQHYLTWTGGWTGTVVEFFTKHILNGNESYMDDGVLKSREIYVYPSDFFCPKDYYTGELTITENTRTIHHYAASWVPDVNFISKVWGRLVKLYVRHT